MAYPTCKCCGNVYVERDDADYCSTCSMAYALAIADVAAYMLYVRHAPGVAMRIECGEARGQAGFANEGYQNVRVRRPRIRASARWVRSDLEGVRPSVKRSPLRRRTPLDRSGPIKRKTRMRARRRTPRRESRERDTAYMLFVKQLPCCCPLPHVCENSPDVPPGQVEAHHAAKKPGLGIKCDDRETIPLCTLAHRQCESFAGPFRKFDREQMRAWVAEKIADTQAKWERHQAGGLSVAMAF